MYSEPEGTMTMPVAQIAPLAIEGAMRSEENKPLPPGWVKDWNAQYNSWFYVNTTLNPPQSQWVHPADDHPNPSPGPPIDSGTQERGLLGNLLHRNDNKPMMTMPPNGAYYFQPPPQVQEHMSGGGKMAIGALGGVAAGVFLEHEWRDHEEKEEREKREAYERGRRQGQIQEQEESGKRFTKFQQVQNQIKETEYKRAKEVALERELLKERERLRERERALERRVMYADEREEDEREFERRRLELDFDRRREESLRSRYGDYGLYDDSSSRY